MDAKDRLKLEQLRNRGEACDRLIESLEFPVLPAQFSNGYGPDGYVVIGLDGSIKRAQYQSNTAIATGRAIASRNAGDRLMTDQQPRIDRREESTVSPIELAVQFIPSDSFTFYANRFSWDKISPTFWKADASEGIFQAHSDVEVIEYRGGKILLNVVPRGNLSLQMDSIIAFAVTATRDIDVTVEGRILKGAPYFTDTFAFVDPSDKKFGIYDVLRRSTFPAAFYSNPASVIRETLAEIDLPDLDTASQLGAVDLPQKGDLNLQKNLTRYIYIVMPGLQWRDQDGGETTQQYIDHLSLAVQPIQLELNFSRRYRWLESDQLFQ